MIGRYTPRHVIFKLNKNKKKKGSGRRKAITLVVVAALTVSIAVGTVAAQAEEPQDSIPVETVQEVKESALPDPSVESVPNESPATVPGEIPAAAPSESPATVPSESTSTVPGEDPDAEPSKEIVVEEYVITYKIDEEYEGSLSFEKAKIEAGQPIGKENIPSLTLPEGLEFKGFVIDEKVYSAKELESYVPSAELEVDISAEKIDLEVERYELTYSLSEGCEGKISFATVEIESGKSVGKENIPNVTVPEGWEFVGFSIADKTYTTEELSAYVPAAAQSIEAVTKLTEQEKAKIVPGEGDIEDDEGGDEAAWEYPPGWAGNTIDYIDGNLLIAFEMKRLDSDLEAEIRKFQSILGSDITVKEDEDNFCDVLAVYAVLRRETVNFPYDVTIKTDKDIAMLRSIYWNMTRIAGASNANGKMLNVNRLKYSDVTKEYNMSSTQRATLLTLVSNDNKVKVKDLLSNSVLNKISNNRAVEIENIIPAGISSERKAVLTAALSLKGKVHYFWGGKSYVTGWDDRWGDLRTVTGTASKTYGTVRPLGLDCSGFISWTFINAGYEDAVHYIGSGTANQYKNSEAIAWNRAMPGDLVFYKNPAAAGTNHVGIVVSINADGSPKEIVHCSSSKNGVVVTDASGFKIVRRPYIYG